jgi:YidC/Oxa1 family membrane protein insertase
MGGGQDQKRVFLAIALSVVVIALWQVFFVPDVALPPEAGADAGVVANGADAGGTPVANPANPAVAAPNNGAQPSVAPDKTPVKVIAPQDVVLETASFKATLTNRGARLKHFYVQSPEQYAPRGDLLQAGPPDGSDEQPEAPKNFETYLSLATQLGGEIRLGEQAMYDVVESGAEKVVFRHADPAGRFAITKTFVPGASPHTIGLTVTLENLQPAGVISDELEIINYGRQEEGDGDWSLFDPIPNTMEAVCFAAGDPERMPRDDAAEKPTVPGPVTWAGVDTRYFTNVVIPDEPFEKCRIGLEEREFFRAAMVTSRFTLEPGQSRTWNLSSYVGPKEIEAMANFEVSLEESVDYGVFAFLCRPFRWVLVRFEGWIGNWGLAIILLTLALRMLLFPVNQKAYGSMEGMRRLQPQLEVLRAKYKSDPQRLNTEMMKLYQTEGVSMFGCLPMFIQIPIFFAFYRTIYNSVELYHADFAFWYTDLSAPDPYYVLPVIVTGLMMGQQFFMPQTAQNAQMKVMMWMMPVMFGVFTFVLPSGLGLYLTVSVSLGIAQQYYIRRRLKKKNGDPPVPAKAKKAKAKS